MTQEKTTAQKRNAYRIRNRISDSIFKGLVLAQGDEILRETVVGRFDMPLLSCLANITAKAVMNDPRLNVVLKKG